VLWEKYEVAEMFGRWVIGRSLHADGALRAALLVDLRPRGNHDAYENGETVHVRVSADEQRKKVQCSKYDFCGPVLRRCDFWAGARSRCFQAGRTDTGPGPVVSDPAHSYVGSFLLTTGNAKPFKIADLTNPILQPWVAEKMRKTNEEVLAGKVGFTARSRCWPHGVPGFLLYPVHPIFFIQTSNQVVMTWGQDFQLRHVYLNVPHSVSPKPSWYGESVGHYENGDTLVVDTIGLNDKTYIDNFRTPHTTQLHVVERFKIVNGGEGLEVKVHVEDPGAFTTPWNAVQRYRRDQREEEVPLHEMVCAENNEDHFNQGLVPIPQADKSEF
jgi:hypothetical protein